MVRRLDYYGSTKAISAGVVQTTTWTNSEIPGERVVAYHVIIGDTDSAGGVNSINDVTRIRLSANGSNIVNITPTQLRSYWQNFSHGRVKIPVTANSFTIPLLMLDAPTPDMQDVSQFPARSQVMLELVWGATVTAGSVYVGWTETSIEPQLFPRILASAMNIPNSTSLQRYVFQENGIVRGIWIPHTGLDRAKFALGAEEFTFLPGPSFLGTVAPASIGDLLFEAESVYGDGPSSAGTPLTTAAFSRISAGLPAPVDGSYIELQTAAAWAGVANEAVIYAVAPNGVAPAA